MRPHHRVFPRLVLFIAVSSVAVGCAPRRGLPPTDLATGDPIDHTAPTGRPSGTNAKKIDQIRPQGQVATGNDTRVSRSRGTQGGLLLLWPRVIPSSRTAELRHVTLPLRATLYQLAQRAQPGKAIEARPEPERVCPQGGCVASSAGVLLIASRTGCAAVLQTSRPGRGPATQTPWAGSVTLRSPTVPFRDPPESFVTVTDFVPCRDIGRYLSQREGQILSALRALP